MDSRVRNAEAPVPPPQLRGPTASRRSRFAVASCSAIVALLAAEAWARRRTHRLNQEAEAHLSQQITAWETVQLVREHQLQPGQAVSLRDIIRASPNDSIAYELHANLPGVLFKAQQLTTNSHGFRSAELPHAPSEREITIVGIGDSVMFGHGVADGENYLDCLQRRLQAYRPDFRWRIVNTAVPGYNTIMEVATLREKGLAFQPDLVLVGVVGNDYKPPTYVRDTEEVDPKAAVLALDSLYSQSRSSLINLILRRRSGVTDGDYVMAAGNFTNHPDERFLRVATWNEEKGEQGTDAAPDRYSGLYGKRAFSTAINQLLELQATHGFELIALAHLTYNGGVADKNESGEMLATLRSMGVQTLDYQPMIDAALREQTGRAFSVEDFMASDLVVNTLNGHLSVKGNQLLAKALYADLDRLGLLDRLQR